MLTEEEKKMIKSLTNSILFLEKHNSIKDEFTQSDMKMRIKKLIESKVKDNDH